MNTHTYFFNTRQAPFNNADVRKALSMALDRNAIADIVVYAKPAAGMVPGKVFDADTKNTFIKVGGDLIAAGADLAASKNFINSAGVTDKSFTITIRPNEVDRAVAQYCIGVWAELGFTVDVRELGTTFYQSVTEYDLYSDAFNQAIADKDFDVIAIDWQAISTDAWSTLAPFAKNFAGAAKDLISGDFDEQPHVTGYDSTTYDELIDQAFEIKDKKERTALLHDAEEMLVSDMPVMPLFEYQHAYMVNAELSNVKNDFYGYNVFTKTKFKNYMDYETVLVTVPTDEDEDAE